MILDGTISERKQGPGDALRFTDAERAEWERAHAATVARIHTLQKQLGIHPGESSGDTVTEFLSGDFTEPHNEMLCGLGSDGDAGGEPLCPACRREAESAERREHITSAEILEADAKRRAVQREQAESLLEADRANEQREQNRRVVELLRPELVGLIRETMMSELPEAVRVLTEGRA